MHVSAQRDTTQTVVVSKLPITHAKRNLVPLLRTLFFLKSNTKIFLIFDFKKIVLAMELRLATLCQQYKTRTRIERNMRIVFFTLILLLISLNTFPQTEKGNKKQYPSISSNYAYGNVLPTNPFVKGENKLGEPIENYQAFTLKVLWQNPGYTDWQKVYKGPYYGIGITVGDFYNPDEIGYPISYYGILGIPIIRWSKLELYTEFQFGLTSN